MLIKWFAVSYFINIITTSEQFVLTAEENALLPPIFHIDDYYKCQQINKPFCTVFLKLHPLQYGPNSTWKYIQGTIGQRLMYRHDELYYAVCVSNYTQEKSIESEIALRFSEEFKHQGIFPTVNYIDCNEEIFKVNLFDWFMIIVALIHFSLIICATVHDYSGSQNNNNIENNSKNFVDKYLMCFSLRHNWAKFSIEKSQFDKLKSMQGLRFYTMVLIIFFHTFTSFAGGFVSNTEYFEELPTNFIKNALKTWSMFLVQAFFLLSSWLMSYHLFQAFEDTNTNKLQYIILTIVNRYLRIFPVVAAVILSEMTTWVSSLYRGPLRDLYFGKESQRCFKSWWANMLFINNHCNHDSMCYFITWYLAADTQLYIFSLILLYTTWKWKRYLKFILTGFIFMGVIIQTVMAFIYETDFVYRVSPENIKVANMLTFELNTVYTSTYSHMATYMLGIGFGYLYYKHAVKHENVLSKNFQTIFWTIFPALPIAVVLISCYSYNRILTSILAGITKPLYALGLGVGILGMSQNYGGIFKSLFEWKPVVLLASLTYSTYIIHYGLVFSRTALTTTPVYITDFFLITRFMIDVVMSFIAGCFVHITLELPWLELQNLIIPKPRKIYDNIKKE